MIYISTYCVKHKKIKESIEELVKNGFKNIELSGGTEYYADLEYDLLKLKGKYNLNYLIHNYFPPAKEPFTLNLASLDDGVYLKTLKHIKDTIILSQKLDVKKISFHAGFFVDIKVSEIGKKITNIPLYDKEKSLHRFIQGFNDIKQISGDLEIYIENNVISSTNYQTFDNKSVFMLCDFLDYVDLKKRIEFNLLLDIGHLKVSSNVLKLDFEKELLNMLRKSDYIHISDNDGFHDLNYSLEKNSELAIILKKHDLSNKDFTLEINDDIYKIKNTYEVLQEIIK